MMAQRKIVKTGYNYTQGFSWEWAGCILDKPEIKGRIPLNMYYDTRRVLSFLLAWSRFPLFNEISGRNGRWIAFGIDRMRVELGIRAERIRLSPDGTNRQGPTSTENLSSLFLLKQLGIVQSCKVNKSNLVWPSVEDLEKLRFDTDLLSPELGGGPDGYFHRHRFQINSLFYYLHLNDFMNLSLLERTFNPFWPQIESCLERVESTTSQSQNGLPSMSQASSKPDSRLHVGSWNGINAVITQLGKAGSKG